ncbi:AAA family ATPase [Vagococcus xieshaowenii]|uniref:Nuclease SbcCD subunit C n=1 Tax=Vagococcus xieshaowenii TaxID=2562451 RepID=A0AAJ5JME2_9ENTE|nr:SMC family ATPase [Vagococcus xieshaowenii]QCA27947.1 SMC family ATPase [Vagococcus xieshaowenii]TFZ41285.1 SMC family ATPase [Vagococcus xieshaowenii]
MKPIRLEMQNFGPYRYETIDFSIFSETPLFLISGKTGSGKTTIFDGMCYALYGQTTGGMREAQEMRSNFADASRPTRVVFVFEHQGTHYEVAREPKQLLAKKKGNGMTEKGAKVSFSQLNDQGEPINQLTKINEVTQAIDELLHLNATQFTQIILLPQGEFRRFLNADSDAKEVVLRRLFSTRFYHVLADKLKQVKKEENKRLEKEEQELEWLFGQLNLDDQFQQRFTDIPAITERLPLILEQNAVFKQQGDDVAQQVQQLERERQLIEQQLHDAEQLAERFAEQAQLTHSLEVLTQQQGDIDTLKQEVLYWEWLDKQQPNIRQLHKEQAFLTQSEQIYEESLKAVTVVVSELAQAEQRLKELEVQEINKLAVKEQVATIDRFLPKLLELRAIHAQQKEQQNALQLLQEAYQTAEQHHRQLLEQQEIHQTEVAKESALRQKLAEVKEQATALRLQVSEWERLSQQVSSYVLLMAQLAQQTIQLKEDREQSQQAQQHYQQKKSEAAKRQIARLSLDLIPGEACPVCGSLEHPIPHDGTDWSVEAIIEAEQASEQAEQAYLAKERQAASTEQLVNEYQKQQAEQLKLLQGSWQSLLPTQACPMDWTNVSSLIASKQAKCVLEQTAITTEMEEISQQLDKIEQLKKALVAEQEVIAQHDALIQDNQAQQQPIIQSLTKLEGQEAQLIKEVPEDWQTKDYQAQRDVLQTEWEDWQVAYQQAQQTYQALKEQQVSAKEKEKHQQAQLINAQERLRDSQNEVTRAIEQSGFDKTLSELLQDEAELLKLETAKATIDEYEQTKQKQTILLEQLTQSLANRTYPDVAICRKKQQDNQAALAKQQQLASVAQQAIQHNQQIYQKIDTQHQQLKNDWEHLAELTTLADVANGDGRYKLSVERYVLQIYFLETLKVANQKLRKLTNDRYSFELEENFGTYGKNTGLELNVYDDNVGASRSVTTLSGGESFVAALSLSLALGEVMQAQAGGIRVDALFIDEGFGSLDEDSLEMAIEALELVESKGRMIGIISHVKELKERIPQQIQVVAGGVGESHIKYQLQEG